MAYMIEPIVDAYEIEFMCLALLELKRELSTLAKIYSMLYRNKTLLGIIHVVLSKNLIQVILLTKSNMYCASPRSFIEKRSLRSN